MTSKMIPILLHYGNAPMHTSLVIHRKNFNIWRYPAYNPDIAPSSHRFPMFAELFKWKESKLRNDNPVYAKQAISF